MITKITIFYKIINNICYFYYMNPDDRNFDIYKIKRMMNIFLVFNYDLFVYFKNRVINFTVCKE